MMAAAQRSQALDFCHDTHSTALLQGLQELRSDNLLVDVVLCVSGKEIPCHRNVLAACSGYFRAMFCNGHRESKEHKVTIHEASASALQLLVDYAYTSKVTITEDNAVELMEGASFFQVPPVSDACTKFLTDNLCVNNCMKMVNLGGMLNSHLEAEALSFAMKEFEAACITPEFLGLTKDQLIKLISSDDLNAPEETVYTAVLKWINHDTRKRKKEMRELMELVRFPYMDRMYFMEKVETDKVMRKCCPDVVTETLRNYAFPGEVQSPRTRPRHASGLREAVVIIGGNERLEGRHPSVYSNGITMTHSSAPSSASWVPPDHMRENNDHGFAVAVLGTSDIIMSARPYCKLAVVRGKVYAIGGRIDHSPLCVAADVEVYDQSLNKWTEGVPLPEPRFLHAVAVLDGNIYVMGGCDAENDMTSTVCRFIPGDSQWYSVRDMPEAASFITASALNGSIYVAGLPSSLLCYRPEEDLWTVVTHHDTGYRCGMTVFGGEIYIYGGCDSNDDTNGNGMSKVLQLNPEDKSLKQGLQELRSETLLVDVILCVSGKEIPCHRNVLASCSGYFRAMFCNGHRESKEHKVTIHEASASALQLLVDYAYTSKVTITEDNAAELMEGASFFQVPPVSDACTKFLTDGLCVKNCMKMVTVGGMLNSKLEAEALLYAMKEFATASKTSEFLGLTKDQLIKLISSDDLNAPEETVYTAVLKWINHDTRKRKKEMRELMELVRFPFMDRLYFMEKVETDKVMRKCCPDVVTETVRHYAFPGEVQSPRTRPRRASGLREAVVVIGGTKNLEGGHPSVYSNAITITHSSAPSSESWTSLTTMKNRNDHGFAVAILGTSDIIVSSGTQLQGIWLYLAKLNSWSKLTPMHKERIYCKLAVVHGKVYAIGGRINHDSPLRVTADVEVYDQSLNKWTEGVPLPQPRYVHAVAVLDGSIYVMGGRNIDDFDTSTVYRFIPGDSLWYSVRDMPEEASFITASALNGSIYVAGLPSNVLCYRPEEDLWTVVTHTDAGLTRCGMTVLGGEIYIYGGCYDCDNANGTTKVLQLNQDDKSLKLVGTMPKGLLDQASGVSVAAEVVTALQDLKIRHKYKYVIYHIAGGEVRNQALDSMSSDDKNNEYNTEYQKQRHQGFVDELKGGEDANTCRYAVYDFSILDQKEGDTAARKTNKILFIVWCPDTASVKDKMLYASSKDAVKKALGSGITEVQATDLSELSFDYFWEKAQSK
uniref:BTB domain-containing protein n=1 Tax=Branchiostoma floridae TaxID=7739 RepID=C3ZQX7_BRAFL|eukprot:XP_002589007.1 hypothetical protein BRAFLDRAFT_124917 [Branchiostoma floridae]